MTEKQASAELARLCRQYDAKPNPDQVKSWMKALMALPYEKGRLAVDATIAKWEQSKLPPVGFFNARASQIGFEGQPNAGAYSQDKHTSGWSTSQEALFATWVHDQIREFAFPLPLADETDPDNPDADAMERRYWAYVTDEDGYKRRCDAAWRQAWAKGAA